MIAIGLEGSTLTVGILLESGETWSTGIQVDQTAIADSAFILLACRKPGIWDLTGQDTAYYLKGDDRFFIAKTRRGMPHDLAEGAYKVVAGQTSIEAYRTIQKITTDVIAAYIELPKGFSLLTQVTYDPFTDDVRMASALVLDAEGVPAELIMVTRTYGNEVASWKLTARRYDLVAFTPAYAPVPTN